MDAAVTGLLGAGVGFLGGLLTAVVNQRGARALARDAALRAYRYDRLKWLIEFAQGRQAFYHRLQEQGKGMPQTAFSELVECSLAGEHPGSDLGLLSANDGALTKAWGRFEQADSAVWKALCRQHTDEEGQPVKLRDELAELRASVQDVLRAAEDYIHRPR